MLEKKCNVWSRDQTKRKNFRNFFQWRSQFLSNKFSGIFGILMSRGIRCTLVEYKSRRHVFVFSQDLSILAKIRICRYWLNLATAPNFHNLPIKLMWTFKNATVWVDNTMFRWHIWSMFRWHIWRQGRKGPYLRVGESRVRSLVTPGREGTSDNKSVFVKGRAHKPRVFLLRH